ncbi:hypothetical protein L2E82_32220 [Cichorium intybus]|uniref:Uncharacterized protein n=1 Tax=Cichorium intybus TaxID=13427 RepID=A0ACB9BFD0_CICIN|nr:hypothetical protein L2E82_32220 [Cichorium intybus]
MVKERDKAIELDHGCNPRTDTWSAILDTMQMEHRAASSPASRVPSSNFFYLRKPGALAFKTTVFIEDSPDWEETDVEVRVEEGGGDSINTATTPISPYLSKHNSGSLPSPPLPEGAVVSRKLIFVITTP